MSLQIDNHEILSREAEAALVAQAKAGDKRAAQELVSKNLRLVSELARKYKHAGFPLEDIIQEGNVGLCEAIRRFDPERGVRFTTAAGWSIHAAIKAYIAKNARNVKICTTATHKKLFWAVRKARAQAGDSAGGINAEAIAEATGASVAEVREIERRLAPDLSLQAPRKGSDEGETDTVQDSIGDKSPSPEASALDAQISERLQAGLVSFGANLEGRDLEIFRDRLVTVERCELQDLASRWGVSRERVRQIEQRLVRKLREHLASQLH